MFSHSSHIMSTCLKQEKDLKLCEEKEKIIFNIYNIRIIYNFKDVTTILHIFPISRNLSLSRKNI